MSNVAILLTCFNRKSLTLKCLERLFLLENQFDVFLVDDGSNDGTTEAIESLYPTVRIIQGSGNLFWARGMHLAWSVAYEAMDYDFYLWMNDDVVVYDFCLKEIFKCSTSMHDSAIISGIIESEDKKEILYGGFDSSKKKVKPNGKMQPITNLNGNIVLVPKKVFNSLGNIDPYYHHDLGDVDYGLRAIDKGFSVMSTTVPIASGNKNLISRLRQNRTSMIKRFKKLYSPLGNPPPINFYFRKKHMGLINACTYWLFLHFLNIIPDSVNSLIFKNKYQ